MRDAELWAVAQAPTALTFAGGEGPREHQTHRHVLQSPSLPARQRPGLVFRGIGPAPRQNARTAAPL